MNAMVKQRRVFYLSGFDPRGVGHYHRLYKSHAALQGGLTGVSYDISPRRRLAGHLHDWHIKTTGPDGVMTDTSYHFLGWEDIIRAEWSHGIWSVLKDVRDFVTGYIFSGTVWLFGKPSRQPLIAGFYPVVFVVLSFLLAGLGGFALYAGVTTVVTGNAGKAMGLLAGAAAAFVVVRHAFGLGQRRAAFWLLRIYVFSMRWAQGQIGGIDERIEVFAQALAAALEDPALDEVIVVGHSVGAAWAVPVIARALELVPDLQNGKLKLLTLGGCIQLISYHRAAESYRRLLSIVGHDPRLSWLDYSARTDGACFYLQNPLIHSGLSQRPGTGPVLLSPRFFTLYTPATYHGLRRDWYRMHFLYMMAGEVAGDYDYFAITAGNVPFPAAPFPANGKATQ